MDILNVQGSGVVRLVTLKARPKAVRLSRYFVDRTLREWDVEHLVEDAQLVVSELATNALKVCGEQDVIKVRLVHLITRIVIEVWDGDLTAPHTTDTCDDAENGRGLVIVAALSEQWSYYPSIGGGKVVWAQLVIPPYPLIDADHPLRVLSGMREP